MFLMSVKPNAILIFLNKIVLLDLLSTCEKNIYAMQKKKDMRDIQSNKKQVTSLVNWWIMNSMSQNSPPFLTGAF